MARNQRQKQSRMTEISVPRYDLRLTFGNLCSLFSVSLSRIDNYYTTLVLLLIPTATMRGDTTPL